MTVLSDAGVSEVSGVRISAVPYWCFSLEAFFLEIRRSQSEHAEISITCWLWCDFCGQSRVLFVKGEVEKIAQLGEIRIGANHPLDGRLGIFAIQFSGIHMCEKLRERRGIDLSKACVRRIMIGAGFWVPRKLRPPKVHQPCNRRACLGELVQIDGSDHTWYKARHSSKPDR